jgi:hypothetical protein
MSKTPKCHICGAEACHEAIMKPVKFPSVRGMIYRYYCGARSCLNTLLGRSGNAWRRWNV